MRKIEDSKMHIVRCMGLKFCVSNILNPYTTKYAVYEVLKKLAMYDILEQWQLKS